MDKEINSELDFNSLSAEELCKELYGKELNSKKTILEYIDIIKIIKKSDASVEKIEESYNFIYECIERYGSQIKPNTMMYLKNQLKAQLGKFIIDKDPKKESKFLKFFREAYPAKERRKDFTWVIMDIKNITEEQIWTTLTYINRQCLKNNLSISNDEREDIIEVLDILIAKNNIKYINQVKSLEKLLELLRIKIVDKKKYFKIEKR